jgi:hypothetical protein
MKKLMIPMLAFGLFLSRQAISQTPFFTANYDNSDDEAIHTVKLHWQLASEFNTDHFVLERAPQLNPTHFDPLHEIVARGNSEGQAYDDRDNPPGGMVSYYRLKVVLKDGESFYSPVVAVNMNDKLSLALKPSVLTRGGTIHFNANTDRRRPVTVNFFDAGGRLVGSYLVNNSYFDIDASGWTRGIYIYRISDGQHPLIESGKIMIM